MDLLATVGHDFEMPWCILVDSFVQRPRKKTSAKHLRNQSLSSTGAFFLNVFVEIRMSSPLENESSLSSSTKVLGDMTGLGWPATFAR
jgi:hypothetical protein